MGEQTTTILIVDDNDLVRCFFKALLDLYELDSEFATNGEEAVDIWEKGNFNAILMDLEMPIMGGIEATQIIRRREKEKNLTRIPIIAVSGTTMDDPDRKCSEAGMDAFIAKPVAVSDVLDVILPLV